MPERPSVSRRHALRALGLAGLACSTVAGAARAWPFWQVFQARFIAADGRVVDHGTPREHSTSEGQAYAMFFALVAGDQPTFERVWRWAAQQLCDDEGGQRLPAWQWGRRDDGSWGVVDANPASDADLWMAYALLEAGRHWRIAAYRQVGRQMLALVAARELVELPGFGPMLLPGPAGFVIAWDGKGVPGRWRLNPSYLPLSLLAAFGRSDCVGPWSALAGSTVRLVQACAPRGFVADWVVYRRGAGFTPDPDSALSSYDAIRVYLWAGLAAPSDLSRALLEALFGMAAAISPAGDPPLSATVADGSTRGIGPAGFSAALLPYLSALGRRSQARQQRRRAETMFATQGDSTRYYDHVLGLFGLGWADRRYRFLPSGQLWLPQGA